MYDETPKYLKTVSEKYIFILTSACRVFLQGSNSVQKFGPVCVKQFGKTYHRSTFEGRVRIAFQQESLFDQSETEIKTEASTNL